MEISRDKALDRLSSESNLASRFGVPSNSPNLIVRNNQQKRFIPDFIKKEIKSRVASGEKLVDIAKDTGVSAPGVGYIGSEEKVAHEKAREAEMQTVQGLALKRLMTTLGFIDEDKLSKAGLKDLSTVAATMGKVISKTTPQQKDAGVTLVVYAPEIKQESSYKVVEVDPS